MSAVLLSTLEYSVSTWWCSLWAQIGSNMKTDKPLHVVTPLVHSSALSELAGREVFIKLENVQPSGSFKIRGIGWTMQEAVKNGAREFVGSSGGNAGMAMAVAAKQLKKKLTIFIPTSTLPFMIEKLKVSKIYFDLRIINIHINIHIIYI